ncbi:PiggyBac transposable element-derived protein 3 [Elysia marginata]|uniref:PiggyBac transposable element-derived protein 3 n=1 Tax=Elysia marginata TaxID=1093978 RepID=A0AAV4H7G2_9GAST|nr:PiggyBac transposable element-derived protein 3 [Elysia marginata]
MFWENAEDSHNQLVSSAMTVNRFEEILSILHLAENTKLYFNDKMAKVRPILSMLNERYLQFWTALQSVNVDGSMIPYYGRHSAEQFIRGKPIRYGYKMWCLNTPDGYLFQSEPYQGQGSYKAKFGHG